MLVDQGKIFLESEGDRWFERNIAVLEHCDPDVDLPLRLMNLYNLCPANVMEVGASNGYRLATIAQRYGSSVVAVEPSADAIRDGQARFPAVEFVRGTADAIDLETAFDLVIANFVFHWVDRGRLLRAMAEIDRLLSDGGHLIIGDFLPDAPTRVRYHHLPDELAYTYKQNYASVFLASGIYRQVAMLTADHSTHELTSGARQDERIAVWLLRKGLLEYYAEASFVPR